ncbi:MAG: hypothetical protein AB8G22_21185 [Saprospiraceae bacterium]
MGIIYNIYDRLAEMLAQIEPQKLMNMRADEQTQQRFDALMQKNQDNTLTLQEKDELDHFIVLERLFRLAKMRADGLKSPNTYE